jgi:hypothetical protein
MKIGRECDLPQPYLFSINEDDFNHIYNFLVKDEYVGFEVLLAVDMKSSIFWDTPPCSPLKFNKRFRGICRFHLLSRRISRVRNKREHIPLKRRLSFNGLHDLISLKT